MQDELATIDVSPLDALGRIKLELDTLEQRLAAMEQRKETVAAAVYMRVRTDYEARRRALEDEAAPLQAVARQQYAQLRDMLARSEADHETTRLDREEIEFRFSLGEFDDAEHKKRIKAVDKQLADKAAARAQAEAMKQRFVSVFRSEEELEIPMPAAPAAPAATRKLNTLTDAQLASAYDTNPGAAAAPAPPMATSVMQVPPVAPGASPGATQMMRAIRPGDIAGTPPAAPAPPAGRADSTKIMRTARMVPQNPEAGKQNYTLAIKPMLIGSDEACDVRIAGAARRHAEIRVSMAGFTLSDEGGGVRVNNVAVTQHLLRHEDVLEFGPARFVFREG
jgi:hypothetical protein